MAVVTVAFEDLDSWLQAQPANTVDTPYELDITGLTASDISRSSISGTLGYILKQNSTKYVDLSRTTIPSDNILWESFFACTSLVIAPKISTGVRELNDTFRSCINLVTVPMLPNGVTEMSNTFEDCRHLVNISAIPDGVTKMFKTFKGCTALIIAPAISNSVTEMIETFYDCTSLVTIPSISNKVKNLEHTFSNCTSLVNVPLLPSTVTTMYGSFSNCSSLANTPKIPNEVTNMSYTFKGCTSLINAPNIPNDITNMSETFNGCTSLTIWQQKDVISPSSYSNCFKGCTNLTNIESNQPYELKNWLTTIRTESTDNFPTDVNNCNFTLYSTPAEIPITSLSDELSALPANTAATPYAIKITELSVASSGTSILHVRQKLINNSTKYVDLSSTVIPVGTTVRNYSLYGCFKDCITLVKSPNLPISDILKISDMDDCYNNCSNLIEAPVIPNHVTTMNATFWGCTSLVEAPDIPSSVTDIRGCFNNCTSLTSAPELPEGIESLRFTFSTCSSLTEAPLIPSTVTNMQNAFSGCTGITEVSSLAANVTTYEEAFLGCTALTTFKVRNFNSNVIETYTNAFKNCSRLTTFHSNSPYNLKTWLTTIKSRSSNNFPNNVNNCSFYLYNEPAEISIESLSDNLGALTANTTDTPFQIKITGLIWIGINGNCFNIRTALIANPTKYVDLRATYMPDEMNDTWDPDESSPQGAVGVFQDCTSLIEGVSFTSLSILRNMSFGYQGCTNLKHLPMIPPTVYEIRQTFRGCSSMVITENDRFNFVYAGHDLDISFAFRDCTSITRIPPLPERTTVIPSAFRGCTSLVTVPELPSTITDMHLAFLDCTALETISNVPASVTNLNRAFEGCSSLETIECFEVPTSILRTNAEDCFKGCDSLTYVGVPAVEIGQTDGWNLVALDFDENTVQGKVFLPDGTESNIPQTTITKKLLTLKHLTDELMFTNESDIINILRRVLKTRYGYFNETVLPPDKKNFVMYAEDPDAFISNINFGGGGGGGGGVTKEFVVSSKTVTTTKDRILIINGSDIEVTLDVASELGTVVDVYAMYDCDIIYYTDASTTETLSMVAGTSAKFVFFTGWKVNGIYGAMWN